MGEFHRRNARLLDWTRRRFIGSFSSISLLGLAGCSPGDGPSKGTSVGPVLPPLIDAHCHLFNVTDLPAASFCRIVLLRQYEHEPPPGYWESKLIRVLDYIETKISKNVLTAADEASQHPQSKLLLRSAAALSAAEEADVERATREAEEALKASPLAGSDKCDRAAGGPSVSARSAVRWLRSLRSPRAKLAMELISAHAKSGYASRLLCPALVDYSNWLGQTLGSPLPDQMRAAGKLARNPVLPPIHGYMAFDPLRQALVRTGKEVIDGTWDPRALTREALVDHGFLGVKLYPPMGFRPSGNATASQSYPPPVQKHFSNAAALGEELDLSLDKLWELCLKLDAPIMAHAANSNAAGCNFGRRADPAHWLPVAVKYPKLRIMLGHFGRFGSYSDGQPHAPSKHPPFDATWEAAIGRFVRDNSNCLLFADISYLSELFDEEDRARSIEGMKEYLKLDPGGRHLVFGTDWVMLGIEKEYPKKGGYPTRIAEYLAECGLDAGSISGVMYGNAIRFLGLSEGSVARRRLLDFYSRNNLPPSRLPA